MTETFLHEHASFLHIEKWKELQPSLIAGFTTRQGGVSEKPYNSFNQGLHIPDNQADVLRNRQQLAEYIQMPLENWVSGEQVHSASVIEITDKDKGKGAKSYTSSLQGIDGIITKQTGILCTAFFADCVPLFFYDPKTAYVGIAHAGWKGTVNRIAETMVEKLEMAGVCKSDLLAAIGPSISQEMYEVDEHVLNHIPAELQTSTVHKNQENHYLLDLKQLNKEILLHSGVLSHHIDVTNFCTYQDKSLFFSHRRDNGKTGRMLGFIGYSNDEQQTGAQKP